MKGTWEDLPASPCSGASCETTMRSSLNHSSDSRPFVALPHTSTVSVDLTDDCASPRSTKRARTDLSLESNRVSVEFAEPSVTKADRNPHFVSRLNLSAEDERRKELLERLRAIDVEKAVLQASPTHDDDDVILVAEKPATKQKRASARQSVRRKTITKRAPAGTTKGPAKQIAQQVIDVDDESAVIAPVRSGKGKGKNATPAKAKAKAKAKPVETNTPKRVSSRIRRRRVPNSFDEDVSNRPQPLPTCMSKCRRLQFCKRLINTMLRDSAALPFSAPVNELWPEQAIPRYFDVIRCPMDLRTLKRNLETTKFLQPTPGDYLPYRFDAGMFVDDARLIFNNARLYNKAGDTLHSGATALLADFERAMRNLPPPPSPEEIAASIAKKRSYSARKKDREVATVGRKKETDQSSSRPDAVTTASKAPRRKVSTHARQSYDLAELEVMPGSELRNRLRYLQDCRVPVIARTPVPKGTGYLSRAAVLYHVEMTWQEKNHLRDNVEKVPESKLEAFIAMIKKSSKDSAKEESNECFELDMDSLCNVGLRNIEAFLEEFVPGFKTIRSSTLGREFSNVAEVDDEIAAIRRRLQNLPREEKRVRDPMKIDDKPKSFYVGNDSSSDSSSSGESGSETDSSDDSDDE